MRPDVARYEKNLREELDGSALYAALAAAEVDPVRKDLFRQLSQAEAGHAQLWREKLAAAGVDAGGFTASLRTRILARLARRFGPRFVLPAIAATEFADRDNFPVGDRDVAAKGGHAGAINDSTIFNHEIIRHRLSLLVMRRWVVGQRARGGEGRAPSLSRGATPPPAHPSS